MARVEFQPIIRRGYQFPPSHFTLDLNNTLDMIGSSLIDFFLTFLAFLFLPLSLCGDQGDGFSSSGVLNEGKYRRSEIASPGPGAGPGPGPVSDLTSGLSSASAVCEGCQNYDLLPQQDSPRIRENDLSRECDYPCQCMTESLQCKAGIAKVKDGCNCCYMCPRQQGDLCNDKEICDDQLHCDKQMGVCRAKAATPCQVNGQTYKDGDIFEPNCRQICTCQNGTHACTSKCPQEDIEPSRQNCKHPQLISIHGQCCREWVCSIRVRPTKLAEPITDPPSAPQDYLECQTEIIPWSSCSATCGIGVSIKVSNDNEDCQSVQQTRLCMIRPCGEHDDNEDGRCRSTWRPPHAHKLHYNGCTSVEDYRPKFCSSCRRRRCCLPDDEKTIEMEFLCADNQIQIHDFSWIKSCHCSERCP